MRDPTAAARSRFEIFAGLVPLCGSGRHRRQRALTGLAYCIGAERYNAL